MVGSIDPRCETLRGSHWPKKGRLVVWNSRRGSHLGQRSTDRINRPDIWSKATGRAGKKPFGTGVRPHVGPPVAGDDPLRGYASRHIGGVMPSRPTLTRLASSVPSSFLVAPKMMILAPGVSSDLSPGRKVTIGVPGGTTTFFSPSLYLTRMFWPSVPATVWATVALVMVELGRRSQGRKPSAAPRWASGKMCTASAFWVPSGSGIAETPI